MGLLSFCATIASAAVAAVGFIARSVTNCISDGDHGNHYSNHYGSSSYQYSRGSSGYDRRTYSTSLQYYNQPSFTGLNRNVPKTVIKVEEPKKTPCFLRMDQLEDYPIPGMVLSIEKNDNTAQSLLDIINMYILKKASFRKDPTLYIKAYNIMVFFEEAVDELKIRQYDRKGVKMQYIQKREFRITLGAGSDELLAAIDEGQVYQLKLTTKFSDEELKGKINRKESNNIYIHLYLPYKSRPAASYALQEYDLSFILNKTVHQLQHNALDFIQKHRLYDILINNPLYHTQRCTMSVQSSTTSPYLSTASAQCSIDEIDELNREQLQAVNCIVEGKNYPLPYLLYGPPGTGKTKTVAAAIRRIVGVTAKNILVCAQSNAAADEIALRLSQFLSKERMLRMYSASHELDKVPSPLKTRCNLFEGAFKYPELQEIYKYRVLICTLSTSGCLTRARSNGNFKSNHFGYVFIDECASASETMSLIPIAGLCTSVGRVHANIVLIGDPKQLDSVTKSKWSEKLGFKTSWFEQLFNLPLYSPHTETGEFNKMYITQLLQNYRSHPAILKVPSQLFYDKKLKAMVSPEPIEIDVVGLLSKNFPIIFRSVQGYCRRPANETSSFNPEEIEVVMEFIEKLMDKGVAQADVGVVSPYKLQCKKIYQKCHERNYKEITIGSAEVFQGKERKVMIMTTVRARQKNIGNFLSNSQRLNVMITRAQSLLIIVGDPFLLNKDPNWSTFIKYCMRNRCLVQSTRNFHIKM